MGVKLKSAGLLKLQIKKASNDNEASTCGSPDWLPCLQNAHKKFRIATDPIQSSGLV